MVSDKVLLGVSGDVVLDQVLLGLGGHHFGPSVFVEGHGFRQGVVEGLRSWF